MGWTSSSTPIGGGAGKVLFDAEAYPRDAWDWIYELNVRSTLVATQAAVKAMIAGGRGGRVLNISSVRATLGINAGYSAYVAAKGAISSLTRQWATEWAKHGITVNAIAPTFVDTPQVAMLLGDPAFKAVDRQPDPAGSGRRNRRPHRAGALLLLRCVVVRDRSDPRDRRRAHRHPVAPRSQRAGPGHRRLPGTDDRPPVCAMAIRPGRRRLRPPGCGRRAG